MQYTKQVRNQPKGEGSLDEWRREQVTLDNLYVIVVNWNLPDDTIACVKSLLAAGAAAGHVIVVDNGSAGDSVARIQAACGDAVWLLPSPTNLGFAGGNNLAIDAALKRGASWIALVNNDTIVAPDFFAALESCAAEHPQFQIIAPLILYSGEPNRIWSLGDRAVAGTLITRSLLRNVYVPADLEPFWEVDFLNACGLLVHRTVFETAGLFDTDYFMYGEDVDFFWRARSHGFRLGCCTRAHMWHKVSRSTGVRHPLSRYWRIANQVKFYRTYANWPQRLLLMLFTALRSLRLWSGDIRAGQGQLGTVTLRAWWHGWFGSAGRRHMPDGG